MRRPPSTLRTDTRTRAAYAEAAGIYRVVPEAVAIPETTSQLMELVGWANRTRHPLILRGAGSGMPGHNVGRGVVVDLTRLDDAPLRIDTDQQTAAAGSALTIDRLNHAAAIEGLRLPPRPSSGRWATLGGMIATNAAGARSFRHGSIRPWVQAVALVTVDREEIRLERGQPAPPCQPVERFRVAVEPALRAAAPVIRQRFPKTAKNSAGYALDRWLETGDLLDLVIGAEGTLGIVTEVRLRLDRLPEAVGGLRVAVRDDVALLACLDVLRRSGAVALEFLDGTFLRFVAESLPSDQRPLAGAGALLLAEYEGSKADVAAALARARRDVEPLATEVRSAEGPDALAALWDIRHQASSTLAGMDDSRRSLQVIEDGCVPAERLGDYLCLVRQVTVAEGVPAVLFGHAGCGHVHVNLLPETHQPGWEDAVRAVFEQVSAAQLALGGTPAGEHGVGRLRTHLLEDLYGKEITSLFREIKSAFDPRGILNPGVIIPTGESSPLSDLKVGEAAASIPDDIGEALRDIERQAAWDLPRTRLAEVPA